MAIAPLSETCPLLALPATAFGTEASARAPFAVKRIYYVYGVPPATERGFHAHRGLKQFATCVSGSCEMLLDNGREVTTVTLDRPDRGLVIAPMVWHVMSDFSSECVLAVLADEVYDPEDYIRSREEFDTLISLGATVLPSAA
jgi:dTDP-4-dehydrorhamnose 3,5-epimerase-like enzyme